MTPEEKATFVPAKVCSGKLVFWCPSQKTFYKIDLYPQDMTHDLSFWQEIVDVYNAGLKALNGVSDVQV